MLHPGQQCYNGISAVLRSSYDNRHRRRGSVRITGCRPVSIISGTITTSVEIETPGRVTVAKMGGIGLAPMTTQTKIMHWVDIFQLAGFEVQTYRDYRAMKWSKALLNMLGNATAAILDMPVEEVYADRRLVALERQAFLEALHVMEQLGIKPVNLPRYPAATLALAMRRIPLVLFAPLLRRR